MSALKEYMNSLGTGRGLYNPRKMPVFVCASSAAVALKNNSTSLAAYASEAGFFAQISAGFGAIRKLTSADAYETLVEIAGAGYCGWVMTASCNSDGQTHTQALRLTVDGQEFEFSKTFIEAATSTGCRAVIGGCLQALPAITTSIGYSGLIGSYGDSGFQHADGRAENLVLIPTQQILALGGSCLKFERALKIEAKTTRLAGTDPYLTAACDYCLEG